MSKKRLLITGAAGQLGTALRKAYLNSDYEVIPLGKKDLDITDREQIIKVFANHRPQIVINCAAYNNVEGAEEEAVEVFKQNAIGPYLLAQEAKIAGAILIHISTDYVFDGEKEKYTESDCPRPLNVYGASKLAGENLVLIASPNNYIIRTSWLFGPSFENKSRNFVMAMLSRAKENSEIRVVNDQFGCPTYAFDLGVKIRELLEKSAPAGIYHLVNSGYCSRYDFAKKIFQLTGREVAVTPITTGESGTKVRRPGSSILVSKKLQEINIPILRAWTEALADYLKIINQ